MDLIYEGEHRLTPETKRCKCCKRDLPKDAFGRLKSRPDGLQFYCRECSADKQRAARIKNPKKYRDYNARWKADNRERVAGYSRAWRARNPEKHRSAMRRRDLRRLYGLTPEEFDSMIVTQFGRCACCDDELRKPCVDHSHKTKHVRALLCPACNFAIGHAQESVSRLRAMIVYLERFATAGQPATAGP